MRIKVYKNLIKKFAKKMFFALRLDNLSLFLAKTVFQNKVRITVSNARKILESYSKKPKGTCFAFNRIPESVEYDLTIIVPVYNIEKRLKKCIDSIVFQKTKYSFLLRIIDDGSTDMSGQICDEYAVKYKNIDVQHILNGGAAKARNKGLKEINSKYIMFIDSDDYLADNAIEILLDKAFSEKATIVQGQHQSVDINNHILSLSQENELHGFPWGSVFESSVFKNIFFPEGYLFEDTVLSMIIYPYIQEKGCKTIIIKDIVYNYFINDAGSSKTFLFKPRAIETYWITELLYFEHSKMKLPLNEKYFYTLLDQIIINCKRTVYLPVEIQKSIFVLSRELLIKSNFLELNIQRHKLLLNAIRNENFNLYKVYCITR